MLEGKSEEEIKLILEERETKKRATVLEIIGDIPDADIKPPDNVLFVCKLNQVTNDDDLELIFSRFGKIINCEVIRDHVTGDSLCYAFIEFENKEDCENAYFKMDNVIIDDRRIHVDFSQSVSKLYWKSRGKGSAPEKYYENDHKTSSHKDDRTQSRYKIKENKISSSNYHRGSNYDYVFDKHDDSRMDSKYEKHDKKQSYYKKDSDDYRHSRSNRDRYSDSDYKRKHSKDYERRKELVYK